MKKQIGLIIPFLISIIAHGQVYKSVPKTDSLLIPSFEIEIVLSEKAKQRIQNPKESIIVNIDFEGEPKDTIRENLDEATGRLVLLNTEKEVFRARQVFRPDLIPANAIPYISELPVKVSLTS